MRLLRAVGATVSRERWASDSFIHRSFPQVRPRRNLHDAQSALSPGADRVSSTSRTVAGTVIPDRQTHQIRVERAATQLGESKEQQVRVLEHYAAPLRRRARLDLN